MKFSLIFLLLLFLFQNNYLLPTENIDLIIINKSLRELNAISKNKLVKRYKISLGFEPIGKKIKKGDGKTPEGLYFLESKIKDSSYYLALKISYPNNWDIRNALKQGFHPGGQIMIHGVPNKGLDKNFHNTSNDWTQGCIALTNKEVKYLWNFVPKGTPILIRK